MSLDLEPRRTLEKTKKNNMNIVPVVRFLNVTSYDFPSYTCCIMNVHRDPF